MESNKHAPAVFNAQWYCSSMLNHVHFYHIMSVLLTYVRGRPSKRQTCHAPKVRNQFEAWPGGTFCLFLLHHRECFVLLNQIWWRERIVGARQTKQLWRAYQSRATVSIKPEKVSIKPEKAEFHAVSRSHFYIQCLISLLFPPNWFVC